MTDRSDEDAQLAEWLDACRAHPGELPSGVETVHRRLVRVVGRGQLPGGDDVYLKVMAFPRPRDLLRYSVRELPAVREARLIRRVDGLGLGLRLPEVLAVVGERHLGLPRLSLLATRGLPVSESQERLGLDRAAEVAASLAAAGVWQRDFHLGNVLPLRGGEIGLLDLQSAQVRSRPLGAEHRLVMAVKLLSTSTSDEDPQHLVSAGLLPEAALSEALRRAAAQREADAARRVRRCLRQSSEFRVVRGVGETLFVRRSAWTERAGMASHAVGRQGLALWLGDRFLEIRDGRPPTLAGLARKAWWRRAPDRVYIADPAASPGFEALRTEMLDGFRRWSARSSVDEPVAPGTT